MISVNKCDRSMEGSAIDILGDVTMVLQDLIQEMAEDMNKEEEGSFNTADIFKMLEGIMLNLVPPILDGVDVIKCAEILGFREDSISVALLIGDNIQERFNTDEV